MDRLQQIKSTKFTDVSPVDIMWLVSQVEMFRQNEKERKAYDVDGNVIEPGQLVELSGNPLWAWWVESVSVVAHAVPLINLTNGEQRYADELRIVKETFRSHLVSQSTNYEAIPAVKAVFIVLSTSGASDAIGEGGLLSLAEDIVLVIEEIREGADVRTAVERHRILDDYQKREYFNE